MIRLATGVADLQPQILRIGGFSFAAQLAERFRSGSTFLVGDAAHRVSPRGGTGMNTAIHDGFDLGWKLAWVLRGWARPELLDSYERSAGRWPSTTSHARPIPTARSGMSAGSCAPTWATASGTCGCRYPPAGSRRSTCWATG